MNTSKNQAHRNFLAILMLAVIALAGCEGQALIQSAFTSDSEPVILPENKEPDIAASPTPNPSPTPPAFDELTLWLPPQFDPSNESVASQMISSHLQSFVKENPGVTLDIRVKPSSGPGSLLEVLTLSSTVALDAMPSLVLLSRSDLEAAVSRGLLQPIEENSSAIDESDWFSYAQELAILHGTAYGLPFAGDAMGIVYRKDIPPIYFSSWDELMRRPLGVIFPAGDPAALVTWTLYRAAGGMVQEHQGQPELDRNILESVFLLYEQGLANRNYSADLVEYQTDDQAWESFNAGQGSAVITWISRVMNNADAFSFTSLPSMSDQPFTSARGWVWCLVERKDHKKEAAIQLLEHLTAPEFLAQWTPAAGYLPVRPSSLAGWEDSNIRQDIQDLLQHAQLRPGSGITPVMSASLKEAVRKTMLQQSTPSDAVQDFLEQVEVDEEK